MGFRSSITRQIALEAMYRPKPGSSNPFPNPNLQAAWFIDPQNVTGNASASNVGDNPLFPVPSWAIIAGRYGTLSPTLAQDTTFTFLSSHTDNSDPVVFAPVLAGSTVIFTGTFSVAQSTTLGAVIPKNRATAQLWTGDVGALGLGGSLVFDSTNQSFFWVYQQIAATSYSLSQPMAPTTVGGYNQPNAELDTLANGDSLDVMSFVAVNIAYLNPIMERFNATFDNGIRLEHITVFDPDFPGSNDITVGPYVGAIECLLNRGWKSVGFESDVAATLHNCWFSGANILGEMTQVYGGVLAQSAFEDAVTNGGAFNVVLDGDVIIAGICFLQGQQFVGAVYLDANAHLNVAGRVDAQAAPYAAVVWGPGLIQVLGAGQYAYIAPAVSYFLVPTLLIAGQNSASSYATGSPSVWNGGIAISAVNLDAPAGAAGFGGQAIYVETGGSYTSHAV